MLSLGRSVPIFLLLTIVQVLTSLYSHKMNQHHLGYLESQLLGELLITVKQWKGIVNYRYNLKIKWLWHLFFPQSSAEIHGVSHGAFRPRHRSVTQPHDSYETALFWLINLNRQNELIAATTIAIQRRDNVHNPDSQELEGGYPERVGLYLSIAVSPSQNMGKLVKNKY